MPRECRRAARGSTSVSLNGFTRYVNAPAAIALSTVAPIGVGGQHQDRQRVLGVDPARRLDRRRGPASGRRGSPRPGAARVRARPPRRRRAPRRRRRSRCHAASAARSSLTIGSSSAISTRGAPAAPKSRSPIGTPSPPPRLLSVHKKAPGGPTAHQRLHRLSHANHTSAPCSEGTARMRRREHRRRSAAPPRRPPARRDPRPRDRGAGGPGVPPPGGAHPRAVARRPRRPAAGGASRGGRGLDLETPGQDPARVRHLLPAGEPGRAAPPPAPAARVRARGARPARVARGGVRAARAASEPRAAGGRDVSLELVFTAHPTEATRRTFLAAHVRIADGLTELDDPRLPRSRRDRI